jgi:predicted transcriptional regulator
MMLSNMRHLKKITNKDKVTFALLLEGGKARINELGFHVTLTKTQIKQALTQLIAQGQVIYEGSTSQYTLL